MPLARREEDLGVRQTIYSSFSSSQQQERKRNNATNEQQSQHSPGFYLLWKANILFLFHSTDRIWKNFEINSVLLRESTSFLKFSLS